MTHLIVKPGSFSWQLIAAAKKAQRARKQAKAAYVEACAPDAFKNSWTTFEETHRAAQAARCAAVELLETFIRGPE